jgi:phenylpropionate dioxygenase-like ring-hydroxylating dioxygenase large terminal subunit
MVPSRHKLRRTTEIEVQANWKIFAEGFLEGYHIRPLHRDTFYPVQFDNLNVVESFGRNSRIVFPYRRINRLREVPAAERIADGFLTYVYHLFPNVMVATFPTNIAIVILEPLAIDRTLVITYTVTDRPADQSEAEAEVKRGEDFVNLGAIEDREVASAIQQGLRSGANKFFEFGRFEMALGHFHRSLDAALAKTGFADSTERSPNESRSR